MSQLILGITLAVAGGAYELFNAGIMGKLVDMHAWDRYLYGDEEGLPLLALASMLHALQAGPDPVDLASPNGITRSRALHLCQRVKDGSSTESKSAAVVINTILPLPGMKQVLVEAALIEAVTAFFGKAMSQPRHEPFFSDNLLPAALMMACLVVDLPGRGP